MTPVGALNISKRSEPTAIGASDSTDDNSAAMPVIDKEGTVFTLGFLNTSSKAKLIPPKPLRQALETGDEFVRLITVVPSSSLPYEFPARLWYHTAML